MMTGSWTIPPETGRALFFIAVVVLVTWFAAGMWVNVRKGNRVARWLQDGLPLLGEKTTLRWLGSSGVELKIQNPHKPLLIVEVFILFEPRDIPVLWTYFHARGRRDILIVRCQSSMQPRFQLEALGRHDWSARGAQIEVVRKQWTPLAAEENSDVKAYGEGMLEAAQEVLALARTSQLPLVRLAVRRSPPQLEMQWELLRFENVSARRLFETLLQINSRLSARSVRGL
jgi:hypothetical protein